MLNNDDIPNIIWLDKITWECDWLIEILPSFNQIFDYKCEIIKNNSIIISSGDPNINLEYFKKYEDNHCNFILVHLSNQYYLHNTLLYDFKFCKLVIRTQYTPDFNNHKVIFIPLGYKKQFWKNSNSDIHILQSLERKYTWAFIGQVKHQIPNIKYLKILPDFMLELQNNQRRRFIIEYFKLIDSNHFLHITENFESNDCLSIDKYRNVLFNTLFIPCPMGNYNIDSFRLYESLECGCIPLVPKKTLFQNYDYYDMLFGVKTPFVKIEYWKNVENVINDLLKDKEKLEKLRLTIYNWWKNYKLSLKLFIKNKITTSFNFYLS